ETSGLSMQVCAPNGYSAFIRSIARPSSGICARGGQPGHATAPGGRAEIADRVGGGLAAAACRSGQAAGKPSQTATLSPRPYHLPQSTRLSQLEERCLAPSLLS